MKKSGLPLNVGAISLANALVNLDHVQTASRIRSISDAQNLVDFFHVIIQGKRLPSTRLADDDCHLGQHNRELSWRVAQLVLEIYPRISLLPQSLFLNRADIEVNPDDSGKGKYHGVAVRLWRINDVGISVSNEYISSMPLGTV